MRDDHGTYSTAICAVSVNHLMEGTEGVVKQKRRVFQQDGRCYNTM